MKKTLSILLVSLVFFATSAIAQEQTTDNRCSIDCKVLQAVLDYISLQPYKNVFKLIQAIQENAKPMSPRPQKKDENTQNIDKTTDLCSIDCKVLQASMDYISLQPYKDVFKFIQAIQENAKPISPEPLKKDEKTQNKDKTAD